jgi:hypothetical protein
MVGRRVRRQAVPVVTALLVALILSASGFAVGSAASGVNRRAIFRKVLQEDPEWAHAMMKKYSLCDSPKETKHWNKKHAVRITACGLE